MDLKNFNQRFEIIDDIPRFVSGDNFASSFGLQWNTFRKIQLDSYTGTNMSEDRVKIALPFPIESINGLKVLEVGAGAGRFTEILLKYGAIVYSFDLSDAVLANYRNNMPHSNLTIFQGDVESIPFKDGFFDLTLCLGVMQHTRDFDSSLTEIARVTKSNGVISFDHYQKHLGHYTSLYLIYWMLIKQLPKNLQLNLTNFLTKVFFPIHWMFRNSKIIQYLLRRISPISFYYGMFDLNKKQHYELSKLDTHDKNTDHFKRMLTKNQLNEMVKRFKFKNHTVFKGGTGLQCIIAK
jgi:ubiquinone/menaquinone biosynthesis C-methylase UbiE